jgi:hypothetical protein
MVYNKMFKIWKQETSIVILYIFKFKQTSASNVSIFCSGFYPCVDCSILVTVDNQVLSLSITFVCTVLGPWYETNHLHLYIQYLSKKEDLLNIIYSNMWNCFEFACEFSNWAMLS